MKMQTILHVCFVCAIPQAERPTKKKKVHVRAMSINNVQCHDHVLSGTTVVFVFVSHRRNQSLVKFLSSISAWILGHIGTAKWGLGCEGVKEWHA